MDRMWFGTHASAPPYHSLVLWFSGKFEPLFVCSVSSAEQFVLGWGLELESPSFLTLYLLWLLLRVVTCAPFLEAPGLVGQSRWCNWLLTHEGSADPSFQSKRRPHLQFCSHKATSLNRAQGQRCIQHVLIIQSTLSSGNFRVIILLMPVNVTHLVISIRV